MKNKKDPASEDDKIEFDVDTKNVIITLSKQQKLVVIKTITSTLDVQSLVQKDKCQSYRLDRLPSKLKSWHAYALNFIKVLYQKTPWLTMSGMPEFKERFSKFHFDMFYNYITIQETMALLCQAVSKIMNMQLTAADFKEYFQQEVVGNLIKKSSFEMHFVPVSNQKYQVSISHAMESQNIKLKQKNTKTQQETDFIVNIKDDIDNLPPDMVEYIKAFFGSIDQI